jgi:mRNA interferase RelE/StbE
MKTVLYSRPALNALRKHANRARSIMAKINQYAADPDSLANNITVLVGRDGKRLRVGDFRVLFTETEDRILIEDIGPRGEIYG